MWRSLQKYGIPGLTVLTAVVAVIVGPIALEHFPDHKIAIMWWTVAVAATIAILFVGFVAYGNDWPSRIPSRIRKRREGIDYRIGKPIVRCFGLFAGVALRVLIPLCVSWPGLLVFLSVVLVTGKTMLTVNAHKGIPTSAETEEVGEAIATNETETTKPGFYDYVFHSVSMIVIVCLVGGGSAGFALRISKSRPVDRVMRDIADALSHYLGAEKRPDNIRAPKYSPAPRLWKELVESATQSIRVVSINAYEILPPERDTDHPIDLAQRLISNTNLTAKVLVADPTSWKIRTRNLVLNGRYREYYVRNFVRLLLWRSSLAEELRSRITIKTYSHFPSHRMMLSEHRAVVQRYSMYSHGWQDPPILVFNVLRTEDSVPGLFSNHVNAPHHSIYKHFSESFDSSWNAERTTTLRDMEDWGVPSLLKRLCKAAKVRHNDHPNTDIRSIERKLEL